MKFPFTLALRSCLFLLVCAAPGTALADDRGPLAQDFQLSFGGFFVSTDTQIRLDGQAGRIGTDIDWEHDLDLEDKQRLRLDAFWRFAENHKVRFMYFENNRSSTKSLSRQIEFGDVSFPLNAIVEAELNTQVIELAYEYAFLKRDTVELSGSFGIHDIDMSAALSGSIAAGNSAVSAQTSEEGSLNGPLPYWDCTSCGIWAATSISMDWPNSSTFRLTISMVVLLTIRSVSRGIRLNTWVLVSATTSL